MDVVVDDRVSRLISCLDAVEEQLSARLQAVDSLALEQHALRYRQQHFVRECREYFRANPAAQTRFPDFMVIGTPRAATTWVKKICKHTANVLFCLGEPRYFSKCFFTPATHYLERLDPARAEQNFQNYSRFVDFAGLVQGEKNPDYLCLPEVQIRLVHMLMPKLKPILLVRDPIDACWSHLQFTFAPAPDRAPRADGVDVTRGTVEAIARVCTKWRPLWSYAASLKHWHAYFHHVHIVFFEDVVNDPDGEARRLFTYIGAVHEHRPSRPSFVDKANQTPTQHRWTDEQFRFLRELFADEYDEWQALFGRRPKY